MSTNKGKNRKQTKARQQLDLETVRMVIESTYSSEDRTYRELNAFESIDWFAGICVANALERGAPIKDVIGAVAKLAEDVSENTTSPLLVTAIADLLSGAMKATDEQVHYYVFGLAAYNEDGGSSAESLAATLKAAFWYSLHGNDSDTYDSSCAEGAVEHAARVLIRETFEATASKTALRLLSKGRDSDTAGRVGAEAILARLQAELEALTPKAAARRRKASATAAAPSAAEVPRAPAERHEAA